MHVRVYNGEHFDRTHMWFVFFAIGIAIVIGLSLRFVNLFGAMILFLFTGAYILFSLTKHKHITISARDTGFVVDTRLRSRQSLESFVVEVDATSHTRKNLIIIMKNQDTMIFSFDDTADNIQAFIAFLSQTLPLVETAPRSTMDKIIRRLKL